MIKANWNSENYIKPAKIFEIDISKFYRSSEKMTYFLAPVVNSITSYKQKLFTRLQMITTVAPWYWYQSISGEILTHLKKNSFLAQKFTELEHFS